MQCPTNNNLPVTVVSSLNSSIALCNNSSKLKVWIHTTWMVILVCRSNRTQGPTSGRLLLIRATSSSSSSSLRTTLVLAHSVPLHNLSSNRWICLQECSNNQPWTITWAASAPSSSIWMVAAQMVDLADSKSRLPKILISKLFLAANTTADLSTFLPKVAHRVLPQVSNLTSQWLMVNYFGDDDVLFVFKFRS